MSLKQKFFSGLTLAFAFVAFTTFAAAQDSSTSQDQNSTQKQERHERRGFGNRDGFDKEEKGGGHHEGGDKMMMRALGRLNLSDSQKEQTRTLFENFKTSTQSQHDEMRGLMEKKRDGVITADETARLKELRTQMRASSEQLHASILAILTPEQRTQLDQMKEQMKERHENRQNQQTTTTQKDN